MGQKQGKQEGDASEKLHNGAGQRLPSPSCSTFSSFIIVPATPSSSSSSCSSCSSSSFSLFVVVVSSPPCPNHHGHPALLRSR